MIHKLEQPQEVIKHQDWEVILADHTGLIILDILEQAQLDKQQHLINQEPDLFLDQDIKVEPVLVHLVQLVDIEEVMYKEDHLLLEDNHLCLDMVLELPQQLEELQVELHPVSPDLEHTNQEQEQEELLINQDQQAEQEQVLLINQGQELAVYINQELVDHL